MGFQSFLSQNTNLSLYAEWKMRKAGVYTLRELFDMDFKECCSLALDYGNFCALMEDRGYEVRHRSRYPSFLPQGAKHPFRAKRNRNPLTVEDIESVIEGNLLNPESEVIVSKTYRPFIPYGKQKRFPGAVCVMDVCAGAY